VPTSLINADNAASVAISNGGLTGAISASWKTLYADARLGAGGKHIFTVTVDAIGTSPVVNVGITDALGMAGYSGPVYLQISNSSWGVGIAGTMQFTASHTNAVGDVYIITFDSGAKKFWVKKGVAGLWNNDVLANQNPATGTGGYTATLTGAFFFPYFSSDPGGGTSQLTFNFGAKATTGLTVPSGFQSTNWKRQLVTSGSTVTLPSDWTDSNFVECIGAGSNGGAGTGTGSPSNGLGGGGGAWSAKWGISGLTPGGSASCQIGAANGTATGTGATWFNSSGTVLAAGAGATTTSGGTTANSTGDAKMAGGNGSAAGTTGGAGGGAGGRGKMAAGAANSLTGTGGNASGNTGGAANNGTTAGAAANTAGTSSTLEYGTAGSGSGAGGLTANGAGMNGGSYGAGGGGGRRSGNNGGSAGAGLIALHWYPAVPPATYRGAKGKALSYLGAKTDAQLYKGAGTLWP